MNNMATIANIPNIMKTPHRTSGERLSLATRQGIAGSRNRESHGFQLLSVTDRTIDFPGPDEVKGTPDWAKPLVVAAFKTIPS